MKKEDKKVVMQKHQTHGKDTGSHQVQIAVLTHKITQLTEHLKTHKNDKHSRRGLIGMVSQRNRLLRSLRMNNKVEYDQITQVLKLRK